MKSHDFSEPCWPSPDQRLLLKAAVGPEDQAFQAWQEWEKTVPRGSVNFASARLLPLIYERFRSRLTTDSMFEICKGAYRRSWYKNQILLAELPEILRVLREAGIRTMLLKGAALLRYYQNDLGLRPMGDIDPLVPEADALKSIHLLKSLGWKEDVYPEQIEILHEITLRKPDQKLVDLHWRPFRYYRDLHADQDFWDHAESTLWSGVPVCVMNPADQLFYVCVHGAQGDLAIPYWVADAFKILGSKTIDWDRLVDISFQRQFRFQMRDALSYLKETLQAPVPPEVIERLGTLRPSRAEEIYYFLVIRRHGLKTFRNIRFLWFYFLHRYCISHPSREINRLGWLDLAKKFIDYTQVRWRVKNYFQLPFYALWRVLRRMKKKLYRLDQNAEEERREAEEGKESDDIGKGGKDNGRGLRRIAAERPHEDGNACTSHAGHNHINDHRKTDH